MQNEKIFLMLTLLFFIVIARAESIKNINQNLGSIAKQIDNVNKDLTSKQQKKNDLNRVIIDSNNAIVTASKLLKQLQTTRDLNLQQIQAISIQLPELESSTNNSKQQVVLAINKIYKQLRTLQQESSSILNANSNIDKQRKKVYLTQLLKFEQQKYQNLKVKLDTLTILNSKLQVEVDRLNKQLVATIKKQELLKSSKQAKLVIHDDLDKQIAGNKTTLSDLKQKQAKLNDLVVKLRHSQAKLENDAKLSKSLTKNKITEKSNTNIKDRVGDGAISDNSPLLARKLTKPIDATITINFGEMRDGIKSSGVVYNTPNNAHIYAVSNGKVLYSGVLPGFGQLIVVDNGNDYNSIYSGVISLVKKGEVVSSGQIIASAGIQSNQPMGGVYFELRHLGKPVNPTNIFK